MTRSAKPSSPTAPGFEAKLAASTSDLPTNRFTTLTYESLIANPVGVIEKLYQQLELGDFDVVREALVDEMNRRSGYKAKGSLPSESWRQRINSQWAGILAQHASQALTPISFGCFRTQ